MKVNDKALISFVELVGEAYLNEKTKAKKERARADLNDRLYTNVSEQRDNLEKKVSELMKENDQLRVRLAEATGADS